jgi:hypothetical protein
MIGPIAEPKQEKSLESVIEYLPRPRQWACQGPPVEGRIGKDFPGSLALPKTAENGSVFRRR